MVSYIQYLSLMKDVQRNKTKIEKELHIGSQYNLEEENNIQQVFGKSFLRFYLPIKSKMIGFEWIDDDDIF